MGRPPFGDKKGFKKGPWIPEEDDILIQYIHTHGPGNWRTLPQFAGLQRCGKSCRLRWTNYLRPDIKRGRFSFEEEECIIQLHSILGNKWSAIAARLPGRTDNEIKNYWNTHIRKRLLRNGIDPVTHSPRLDLLDLSSVLGSNQLNLSSLLALQTFLNTNQARDFATLSASNHQNLNTLSQKLIQNQLMMVCEMQNESLLNFQPNTISSFPRTQNINHSQGMEYVTSSQSYQQNQDPSYLEGSFGILANNISNVCDQIKFDVSKISNFPRDSNQVTTSQNVMSESPLLMQSLSPLHPSTFIYINTNSTIEDERKNYQSDIFKFEIPESLDMDDFM